MRGDAPSRPGRPKRIYRGTELCVFDATHPTDRDVVVVTFPARTERQGLHRKGFGQDFLMKRGISSIFVTASWNHWFQTAETGAALEAIRRATRRFKRVVTYGSSMGGYAALLLSTRLRADAVIAISPQISIDRSKVPWERRWSEDAARITFTDDVMELNSPAKITIIYDPRGPDRAHAEAILALSANASPIVAPFGGHPAGAFLRDLGILSGCITDLIHGDQQGPSIRSAIREKRATSSLYWGNKGTALYRAGKIEALQAAKRAVELAPSNHAIQFLYGRLCFRLGDFGNATEALDQAVQLAPTVAKYRVERDRASERLHRSAKIPE